MSHDTPQILDADAGDLHRSRWTLWSWTLLLALLVAGGALALAQTVLQSHVRLLGGLALGAGAVAVGRTGALQRLNGWAFAAGIVALTVGARLAAMQLRFEPSDDFLVYHQAGITMARQWRLGVEGYRCFYAPGQVFSLGVVYNLLGPSVRSAQLLNVAYSVGMVVGVWRIGRSLLGEPEGRLAAILTALGPSMILGTLLTGAEIPGAFWLVAAVWAWSATLAQGRRVWLGAVLTGVLLGVGALIRPQLLLLAGPIGLHWLAVSSRPVVARAAVSAVLAAAVLAPIAPWTYRNYRVTGGFILISSNGGGNLWSANNDSADGQYTEWVWVELFTQAENDLRLQRIGTANALAWIQAHPLRFAALAGRKFALFWWSDHEIAWWTLVHCGYGTASPIGQWAMGTSNGFYLATLAAAIVALIRRRDELLRRSAWTLLPWLLGLYTAIHMVFESQGKYRFVLAPLLLILAGLFARRPGARSEDRS